jgi:hypothetical protein
MRYRDSALVSYGRRVQGLPYHAHLDIDCLHGVLLPLVLDPMPNVVAFLLKINKTIRQQPPFSRSLRLVWLLFSYGASSFCLGAIWTSCAGTLISCSS